MEKSVDTQKRLRWNFIMGLIHGTFYTGGQAFGDLNTILPVFLNNFTSSKILIGLVGSLGGIGGVLPQLFVASRLENKIHKRPTLRIAITIRALCWGLLALITYLFSISHPDFVFFSLFILITIFAFMGGVAVIPFMDIWGKAIPSTLRGKFFGLRQFFGGIVAIGSGLIAKSILGSKEIHFPKNFSLLFFLAFLFMSISYLGLGSVREPLEEVQKDKLPFQKFLKRAFGILKSDVNYRKFLFVQLLVGASSLALPFYVLYAKDILKIKLGIVGLFLSAQMLGGVLSNLLWAHISDSVGNKRVIQISSLLALTAPILALITSPHQSKLFILLFVIIGFFMAGVSIGNTNFLLDMAPPKKRSTYIGLNGTLTSPVMVFPLIGGVIVQHVSYSFSFIITLIIVASGFMLSLSLEEPRKGGKKSENLS